MPANPSDEILRAALSLSRRERVRLARQLLTSIEAEDEEIGDWEAAWTAEVERRAKGIRDGSVTLEDGETALRSIEAELKARRKPTRTASKPRARQRRSAR